MQAAVRTRSELSDHHNCQVRTGLSDAADPPTRRGRHMTLEELVPVGERDRCGGRGRRVRRAGAAAAVGLGALAATAGVAEADSYTNATGYVTSTSYRKVTVDLTNPADGWNMYTRVESHSINRPMYLRWVKCGQSSTQDTASSVGGNARSSTYSSPFQGDLGTGFVKNTCANMWGRKTTTLSGTVYFPHETYFDDHYHL
jgi:hypothetical protein